MLDKVEFYGDNGGLTVNLKRKIVYSDDNRMGSEKITTENIDKVQWVINKSMKHYVAKIEDYKNRLSVTKRTVIPIKDGVKFREPLEGAKREKVEAKIIEFRELVENIKNIDIADLIIPTEEI